MKKNLIILAVGMLMVCLLPLAANTQAQEWQSTSAMQTSGSSYTPQVNAVGAEDAYQMATTTTTNTHAPSGPRRSKENPGDPGAIDDGSPLGDAALPLLLMSLAFAGVIYFRKRQARA